MTDNKDNKNLNDIEIKDKENNNSNSSKNNNKDDKVAILEEKINCHFQHAKLIDLFLKKNINSYKIVETNNYYNYSLEERQKIIGATTTDVMCKTIILENKNFDVNEESKYYKRY